MSRHGRRCFSAAAGLPAGRSAGDDAGPAVRCAAGLPPAAAPADRGAGHPVLHPGRDGGVPLHALSGQGADEPVAAAGAGRRCRGIFPISLPAAAAGVDILGGYAGLFVASDRDSPAGNGKTVQKNCRTRKKSLLFYPEMLYNKNHQRKSAASKGGQAAWQRKKSSQSEDPAAASSPRS